MIRTHLGTTYADDGFKGKHRGPGPKRDLCIMACVFCRDPLFLAWLTDIDPERGEFNESGAKAFILALCDVDSRSKIDTVPAASEAFLRLVREPFMAWKNQATADFYNTQLGEAWEDEQ